jgi:hypothetical protein
MTAAQVSRVAALSMVTVSCAALAACSSGPPPGQQAQSSRASALAAAKNVHSELSGVRIAWNAVIAGGLFLCGTSDGLATSKGPNAVQYTASQDWTLLKKGSVPLTTLGHDIVQKLAAAGWHLRSAPTPNPESPVAATYVGRRNGLDMRLLEMNNNPGLGALVSIDVSASCFNAGSSSSAVKLMDGYQENIEEPRPSSAPLSRRSGVAFQI